MKAVSDKDLRDRLQSLVDSGGFTKSTLGLGNVDNTSDLNKPISNQTQTALNAKINATEKNAANGVAALNSNTKIDSSLLPSISLSSLSDVQISSASANQALQYDGTKWINATAGSGGSGNLAQNTITVGVGDTTTSPQTVTLQGPQGAGSLVNTADLILRPGAGTGYLGSGSIRLQSATVHASQPPIMLFAHFKNQSGVAVSSITDNFTIPSNVVANTVVITVVHCAVDLTSVPSPISSITVAGSTPQLFFSSNNATSGFYAIYYSQNPPTGFQSYTINFNSAQIPWTACVYLAESIGAVRSTVYSQSGTNALTYNTTVTSVAEEDLIVTFFNSGHNASSWPSAAVWPVTHRGRQTVVRAFQVTNTRVHTQLVTTVSVDANTTSVQIGHDFSMTILSGFIIGMVLERARPVDTTAPTFSDVFIVGKNARIAIPEKPLPLARYIELSTSPLVLKLDTSDPRIIIFTNATIYSTADERAGTLRNTNPNRSVAICSTCSNVSTVTSTSSTSSVDQLLSISNTNQVGIVTLIDNNTPFGMWSSSTSISNAFIGKQFGISLTA